MPSHYNQQNTQNQQNDNPVVEKFFATETPKYYKPDGSEVAVGAPLHRHADGTIMTEHSMGPNDNSVVVTTQGNQKMPQARNNGDSVMTENALGQIEGKVYKKNQGGMLQGRQGNQTRGFGDDLGYDGFDPESNRRNLRQQQGNQTAGFGDDLGFDGYDPESFGDDLGIDGFDPERKGGSMKKHLKKNQGGML